MIPILQDNLPVADEGRIGRDLHRWLSLIRRALLGPFIGQVATGAFAMRDGESAIQAEELLLVGTEEATLEGDAVLVIV